VLVDEQALQEIADPGARAVIGQLVTALGGRDAIIVGMQERIVQLEAENAQLRGEDLRNALESSLGENARLRAERQRLRDALAQAKGEQGKPRVLPKRHADHSSEQERGRQPQAWRKRAKVAELPIDRTLECHLTAAELPADATLERYLERTVQDLVLRRDNVLIRRAQYTSARTGLTYTAPIPVGYETAFGPELKTAVLYLHYETNTSQGKIHTLLSSMGLSIASGTIAGMLSVQPALAAEYAQIGQAGLASSPYQHLDATPTRLNGEEWQCHVLGAPLYVRFHTVPTKDRLAVLDVLRLGAPRTFAWNADAQAFLAPTTPTAATLAALDRLPWGLELDQTTFFGWLDRELGHLGTEKRRTLVDALAIGAYRQQTAVPVIETLLVDAAPQFGGLTEDLALCWVHEARHYKKLSPHLPLHQALLDAVLTALWAYYRELGAYQQAPSPSEAARLRLAFDDLFTCRTGYRDLDDRLRLTHARHHALLRVLDKPYLPLTNNPAELAARQRVRKRDVSFGARSPAGLQTWDVLQTIIATAKLLGVNVWQYLHDRVSGTYALPPLADLIRQRTTQAAQLAHLAPARAA
jgi:regulator of replication initiation timing